MARQKHGDNHTEYATAIAWLAHVYQARGRYAEAEPLYKRALAIYEKALGPESTPPSPPQQPGRTLSRRGRYAETKPLYKRSLAIREKALAPDHPDVAQSLGGLAGLYFDGATLKAPPLKTAWGKPDLQGFGPTNLIRP